MIFTINGQTHGDLPKHLFGRKSVKLGRLTDSLLVSVDCSEISVGAREDLFMNSRDRLSSGQLRKAIEKQIEDILHQHPGLRQLANQRREAEVAERLSDSKPLENVLDSILKSSPALASLLLRGVRLSSPHRPQSGIGSQNGQGGPNPGTEKFVGKRHPTYFRFLKKQNGETLLRNCEIGRQCRLSFETDVENDYFSRVELPGKYHAELIGGRDCELNHSLTLHDGRAYWSLEIPDDAMIGDCLVVQCQVADETLQDGFVNVAKLTIKPKSEREPGNGKPRNGQGSGKNESQAEEGGLALPEVIKVREPEWQQYDFDKHSAAKIVRDEGEG